MIAVVSQAWTLDDGTHAEAYIALYEDFIEMHRSVPGFHSRRLLRGVADRCHFTNVRFFESIAAYEQLIRDAGYAAQIDAMGAHLDLARLPPKEYMELVVADGGDLRIATPGRAADPE